MSENFERFDLFGNPLFEKGEKRGRPEHTVTEEKTIEIMVLLADGKTVGEAAKIVGLSTPTLRKHYFHLIEERMVMRERLKVKLRTAQICQGLSGNASSLNGALKLLDAASAEAAERRLQERAANSRPADKPTYRYVGKKEQQLEAAHNVAAKFAPPSGPKIVVNNA